MTPRDVLFSPWPLALTPTGDAALAGRALARIDAVDERVRAWVTVDRDTAPHTGGGPLAGVPFGVKNVIDLAGTPTRCGSATRRDAPPAERDADLVARLRGLGAVPAGATVTTEFAFFQPNVTRNPHDLDRTPGGSSSGSAAAVAAGMVPLALGTQTAGSVVRPAAFCGVAGYAVPRGTLPTTGMTPLAPSLDTLGLFAADVASIALVRAALDDGTSPPRTTATPRLITWDGGPSTGPAMAAAVSSLVDRARAAGAEVIGTVEAVLGVDTQALARDHRTVMLSEAARTIPADARASALLGPRTADGVAEGARTPTSTYRDALARGADARARVLDLLEEPTVIVGPAAPGVAPRGLDSTGDPVMSAPWHLLGLPALAVPGLRDDDGLPLGVAVLGHPAREHDVLAAGAWLEAVISG